VLRLLTFGGLRVTRDEVVATELGNQRRRLAVLACVASAYPAGVTRDRLLLLLWPDADAERGRNALNQIVYNLRRELGTSPIDAANELVLLPDVMTADVVDFRAAVARNDHAAAAAAFAGPFLDAFFVPGATEFDRWVEDERQRTLRQAINAIEKLTAAADAATDVDALVHWTGRLVELDPLSARRALAHMRALERHDEPDAAIAYGRRYEALARADGDDVDAAVGVEVARLRSARSQSGAAQVATPVATEVVVARSVVTPVVAPPSVAPQEFAGSVAATEKVATGVAATEILATPSVAPPILASRAEPAAIAARRWWKPAVLAAAVVVTVWSGAAWLRERHPGLPLETGDRLMLADVQLQGADTANSRALTIALQSALQQSSRVRFVSPVTIADALRRMGRTPAQSALPDSTAIELAEREGARYVVSLSVMPSGTTRLLTLRVLDAPTGVARRTYSKTAPSGDLLRAIDDLSAGMRRDLGDSRAEVAGAIPLPRATTPSVEALRMLASAQTAFNRALYNDARTLYASAVALDSGFAAAHAGLAAVDYVNNNTVRGDSSMQRALALSDRLPPRERLLIEATAERGRGDWNKAAVLHRAYLARYPDDYDMYQMLGYDLMRAKNPVEARIAFDSLKAHRPLTASAWISVASVYRQLQDYAGARKAQVAGVHLDTALLVRSIQNEEIGATLMELGFTDSARAVFSTMLTHGEVDRARGNRSLAYVDLYEGRYASAVSRLQTAITLGAAHGGGALSEVRDRALLASTLVDLGLLASAREQLRAAAALCIANPMDPRLLLWTGKPLARLGDTATVRQLLDSAKARARPTDPEQGAAASALEAELLVLRGSFVEAELAASRAIAADGNPYAMETRAHALERGGRIADARAMYVSIASLPHGFVQKESQQVVRLAPLQIIRLDIEAGNVDAARKQLGRFAESWPGADTDLPLLSTLRARIESRKP
jgi:DNA-binding SARP family transcriptional activator